MEIMKTTKLGYKIVIVLLVLAAILSVCLLLWTPLGEYLRLGNAIQVISVFAAFLAAIIALSATDPKKGRVKVNIELSFTEEREHKKNEMSDELKRHYEDFPDPVKSHRVQFTMTNISGFALVKPNVAFRIPLNRKHPHRDIEEQPWSICTFNSNLYNSRQELRMLEFADTCVISNSNLPYWNDKETITLWIRMLSHDKTGKAIPYDVIASVNCENADGVTKTVTVNPKGLL
jgi:hypothetical protein